MEGLPLRDGSGDRFAMNPLALHLVCVAGWMNRQQQLVIESVEEEVFGASFLQDH